MTWSSLAAIEYHGGRQSAPAALCIIVCCKDNHRLKEIYVPSQVRMLSNLRRVYLLRKDPERCLRIQQYIRCVLPSRTRCGGVLSGWQCHVAGTVLVLALRGSSYATQLHGAAAVLANGVEVPLKPTVWVRWL